MSPGTQFPIRIAEEFILLMLDERSGYLEMVPGWNFSCVMAGAVLADLALEHRIDTDLEWFYLVDPTPTGDSLLDPTLADIAESEGVFGATRTMPGMDGAEHYRMRKELGTSYSRATFAKRLPEGIDLCRGSLARWKEGDVFGATDAMRNHVSGQVSTP